MPTRTQSFTEQGARVVTLAALAAVAALTGCRQDMQNQPKVVPQRGTDFFADGRSVRPQVENTVARGQLHQDVYFYTGMDGGKEGNAMPFPVTMEVLERGQERYNIFCSPCHSRVGNGAGMIVQRGYRPAGNFHTPRLLAAPLGHFFAVITNGYGAMPEYAAQVAPQDRWAIVAYIKALQLSQSAPSADAPAGVEIETLGDIASAQGLPPGFAADWKLPPTAVYGTPNNEDNGIPASATPGVGAAQPASAAAAKAQPATPAAKPGTPSPASSNH